MKRVVFLVGPTASGKTSLSVDLAKKIGAEIISCDSMQVYTGMDILSSKPSREQRKAVRHYLLDVVKPSCDFNVSRYRFRAVRAMNKILEKGKIPLFVGGSGLYVSVVVNGIFRKKTESPRLRQKLTAEAKRKGSAVLHARLAKIDPQAAVKIHPNDTKRIVRALEVFAVTGNPISSLQQQRKGLWDTHDIRIFCLNPDRNELYRRIDRRVEEMFDAGLVDEVRKLLKRKLGRTASCAIGINEVRGYLEGDYGLDKAKELMKRNTRAYAKRQLTWFRKDKRIEWISLLGCKPAAAKQLILAALRAPRPAPKEMDGKNPSGHHKDIRR